MRLPLILVIPLLLLNILVDWYICRAVRERCSGRFHTRLATWSSVLLSVAFIVIIAIPKRDGSNISLLRLMWCLYAYLTVYIGKYIFVIFDLIGKIPCLFRRKRLKWLGRCGAALGAVTFLLMCYGVANRHNIDVNEVEIADSSLPASFDGYRILQLSDIHTGSFGTDTTYLARVVDTINRLKPDVVLFTGDIVNRRSTELEPFTGVLSHIDAPVYSVLGNHDYGDYYNWNSPQEKTDDRRHLAELQGSMGWKLLNNESAIVRRGTDSIAIIGVENIGDPPFPVYGNLEKAYSTPPDSTFKILMSHNPAHWVDDICGAADKNIALTLSGHTHAMQCELFGLSPAALRYKTWGGLYGEDERNRLYVNRGLGEVGFPARIGATPELTLIILKKKQ